MHLQNKRPFYLVIKQEEVEYAENTAVFTQNEPKAWIWASTLSLKQVCEERGSLSGRLINTIADTNIKLRL